MNLQKIRNSLAKKIYTGFILVVIILLMVALWAISNFTELSTAINSIMEENYQSIQASENMVEAIERQDSAILLMISGQEDEGLTSFRNHEQEFFKWFSRAEDNITIEGEEDIISTLNNQYTEYLVQFDRLRELGDAERQEFYNESYIAVFTSTKEIIRELRSINQTEMISAQQEANFRAERARISSGIISVIGILIALFSGYYLTRKILAPVKELQNGIQKVAAKNFNQKLPVSSQDEIGELTIEFNKMIDKLQEYENMNVRKLLAEKEKSEAIVNHISSPLLVTNADNDLILFNEESRKLFDLNDEDLESHFLEAINNQKLFRAISFDKPDQEDSEVENGANILEVTKEDSTKYYRIVNKHVQSQKQDLQFSVTLLEDITRLKEIDQLKSDFISTVSHEFRTPLTSITMALSMLAAEDVGEVNPDQKELLENSLDDCERLTNLVEDLLDLSKMESGRIELDIRDINLKNMTSKTMDHFQNQAENKSVKLYIDEMPDDLKVHADPNKVSWVISNLVSNALRYTHEGDEIKVSAAKRGHMAYLEVLDTGSGINQKELDKIFDKFYRSEEEVAGTGSGLGLAIAKEIINAHGGRIWAESEKGEWTKFTFSLPTSRKKYKQINQQKNNSSGDNNHE
ncbi:MAG: ATP-binding protein [Bacillota bacterium]